MGYREAIALLLLAAGARAAEREFETLLKHVVSKVAANYSSIQSFTCVETVQRDFYRPRASTLPRACPVLQELRKHPTLDMVLQLVSTDRLRLDVGAASRGEIHAWAGASKFEDTGVDSVVRDGPIGTGSFASLLSIVFVQDVHKFVFGGDYSVDGRRYYTYRFDVPVGDSHYRMKSQDGAAWVTVPYSGLIVVNAETADPVEVTIETTGLPPATGACQTISRLNLKRTPMGDRDILMPVVASQRFVSADGKETQNTMTFANCHQYSSESSVTYYAGPDAGASVGRIRVATLPERIPEHIPFEFELLAPIDSATAAGGDRFAGRLTSPLRDGKRVLAPKGARIDLRVSTMEVSYRPTPEVLFGLATESVEIQGTKVPVAAILDFRPASIAKARKNGKGMRLYLPSFGERAGYFRIPGTHATLDKGFKSEWMTTTPRKR